MAIHIERSHLAKIESGTRALPIQRARALDDLLNTAGELCRRAEMALEPGSYGTPRTQRDHSSLALPPNFVPDLEVPQSTGYSLLVPDQEGEIEMVNLRRRLILKGSLAAVALPMLSIDDLRKLVAAVDSARKNLDEDVARSLDRMLAECARRDGALGPRQALPSVLALISVVEDSAREVKPPVRRELLRVGARAAEFAGWLYRDAGGPTASEYWRDRASEWALEAGDIAMPGYILLKKSQSAWDDRDGLRMLTLAQAVQDGPWSLPWRIRAEAAQQEARGLAILGESASEIDRKLDEAASLLARDDPARDEPGRELSLHYNGALLSLQTALCHVESGLPDRAIELYERELSRKNFSHRDYSYFTALKSIALASGGEVDEAAQLGIAAYHSAVEAESGRTLREIKNLRRELAKWTSRPSVGEFMESTNF